MKYGEFAEFEKLVEKIRRDVEAEWGFPVYKDLRWSPKTGQVVKIEFCS
ncbi:MAG: hypothetical protein Q7T57_08710 [Dehalococcoidales bacterium]|nr:hypothetical protein [Dehalococcoidales bacterium]